MKIKARKPAVTVRFHPHVSVGMDPEMRTRAMAADIVHMVEGNRQMLDTSQRDPTLRLELNAAYDVARSYYRTRMESENEGSEAVSEESADVTEKDASDITDVGVV